MENSVAAHREDVKVRIPWLNFGQWSSKSGPIFIAERLYMLPGRWTPIVILRRRYTFLHTILEVARRFGLTPPPGEG